MSLFKSSRATVEATAFSEFIRTASSEQKKRVYVEVMREASAAQQRVIDEAKRRRRQVRNQAEVSHAC